MLAALGITSATVTEWAMLALAFGAAWRISRGGGGSAVEELSKANDVLTRRVHELGAEVRDLKVENAELRQRTDFAAVIQRHEERAQARHVSIVAVLDLIAARLGPESH